jgi:hypothetical protein
MTLIGIYLSISRSSITESGVIQPWAIFPQLSLNNARFNRLLEVSVVRGGNTNILQELQQRQPQDLSPPSAQVITAALGNLAQVLDSGKPRDRKVILEDNIAEIIVQPTGEVLQNE